VHHRAIPRRRLAVTFGRPVAKSDQRSVDLANFDLRVTVSDTQIRGGALAEPAGPGLRTVFCAEGDWRRADAEVTQAGDAARGAGRRR
jgi:hypothetical protein